MARCGRALAMLVLAAALSACGVAPTSVATEPTAAVRVAATPPQATSGRCDSANCRDAEVAELLHNLPGAMAAAMAIGEITPARTTPTYVVDFERFVADVQADLDRVLSLGLPTADG